MHPSRNLIKRTLIVLSLIAATSCAFAYPPPVAPDVAHKQIFGQDPVALLKFGDSADGTIAGVQEGWRFPEVKPAEGIPGGIFTYLGKFEVTSRTADGKPLAATGTREVYYRETEHVSYSDPRSFSMGQHVGTDRISMSFMFQHGDTGSLAVRISAVQSAAFPFKYQTDTITPPNQVNSSELLAGNFIDTWNGYFLFPVNSGGTGQALEKAYQEDLNQQDLHAKQMEHSQ
jgi:hypothetical protein